MGEMVKFTIEGVKGDFFVDPDETRSYRNVKAFALAEVNPTGLFSALERIFDGKDEEYIDRVGGIDQLEKLVSAAIEAVNGAKNS